MTEKNKDENQQADIVFNCKGTAVVRGSVLLLDY